MSEVFLKADNLYKSFNEHKAVNGTSFTIYQGEIFGLLGPNGAGKTTTIRILSTVLEPDRGDVTIGGHSTRRDANAVRHLIGVCPQELALYADLSALDNLLFFGRMVGLNGREAKSQALANLELMGLSDRARGKVDKFSGGMTILYTTHYMEEADRLCHRVAIMDGGQIIAMDTPHELKSKIGPPEQVTLEDVFLKLTGRGLRD